MKKSFCLCLAALWLTACLGNGAIYDPHVNALEDQLAVRRIQSREFESADYTVLMQAVIATLQDYHYRLVEVDHDLGTVSAYQVTKADHKSKLGGTSQLTVFVNRQPAARTTVRLSMRTGIDKERDPVLYQQFFAALQQKLFLVAP